LSLHPHNLAQKTEIIIEHFRKHIQPMLGGKAKAMVVTGSRLHAVRYKQEFDRYITEKKYKDIKTLVAFSGKVIDDTKAEYTEPGMNGFSEKQLREKFATDEYQVLIVANKYQTGFDQPLLCAMYVDKKLSGVRAVQTFSRLNRIYPGKKEVFILDFANDPETIQKSFQPYYEQTIVSATTDPNLAYDLKNKLDAAQVYWQPEVENFCRAYYEMDPNKRKEAHAALYAHLLPAVERYKVLPEAKQEEFYDLLAKYVRLYSYLSLLAPMSDIRLEMLHTFSRYLLPNIEEKVHLSSLKLDDDVALTRYRLEEKYKGSIELGAGDTTLAPSWLAGGKPHSEDVREKLSAIVDRLNQRFAPEKPFDSTDQLFFDQII
ncbi:MAG: type I restriction endonuclease subunit R, partial [Proteobacteria bacterium]|nr:type I restriction endonuclease subunit R [Pseudomonadota bacterium]